MPKKVKKKQKEKKLSDEQKLWEYLEEWVMPLIFLVIITVSTMIWFYYKLFPWNA